MKLLKGLGDKKIKANAEYRHQCREIGNRYRSNMPLLKGILEPHKANSSRQTTARLEKSQESLDLSEEAKRWAEEQGSRLRQHIEIENNMAYVMTPFMHLKIRLDDEGEMKWLRTLLTK